MRLPWPTDDFRHNFEHATVEAVGRPVDFVYISGVRPCTTCILDPVTDTSTDSFCPECSGYYWIDQLGEVTISGKVTWKYSEDLKWYPGGKQFEGDCQVKVQLSGAILDIMDNITYIVVDGRVMKVNKVDTRGAPTPTRIIYILQEQEKDDG